LGRRAGSPCGSGGARRARAAERRVRGASRLSLRRIRRPAAQGGDPRRAAHAHRAEQRRRAGDRTRRARRDRGRPLAAELGWRPMLKITAGRIAFRARLEQEAAPQTVAAFGRLLPLRSRIIHVRWSGEAGWVPFGDLDLGLGPENATCYPHPGEIVLYPGGVSETEILLAYGYVNFASKAGQLAGNHFATGVEGNDRLAELGRTFLWEGAQDISFELER